MNMFRILVNAVSHHDTQQHGDVTSYNVMLGEQTKHEI